MYTDKKENEIFLMYKEILIRSVAKSYMRKGFLLYEEYIFFFCKGLVAVANLFIYLTIYEEAV